eukprot:m.291441 g.291441  ORF g.291441 m.291441 type:complete len:683 (+) comp17816_c0_seq6:1669-3717(+)
MMMATASKLVAIDEEFESDDSDTATLTYALERTAISSFQQTRHRVPKAELAEAVARGRCEPSRPSRSGRKRFKVTHKGMVYIVDETKRHAIKSWSLLADVAAIEDAALAPDQSFGIHAVFMVDHSGSMRKSDVSGYSSRTEAVYQSLINEFLEPQLALLGESDLLAKAVVSLVTMSSESEILLKRHPLTESLRDELDSLSQSRACYHGHYLPALDLLEQLLVADGHQASRVMVFWLSDGQESDHIKEVCALHEVPVWTSTGNCTRLGRPALHACASARMCRQAIRNDIRKRCLAKVQRLGDLVGRDTLSFSTVAFGPADEDYALLKAMGNKLPKGGFQKLGLEAHKLGLAFTSLTSTLTTMRTELGPGVKLTPNKMKQKQAAAESTDDIDWDIYLLHDRTLRRKYTYSRTHWRFENAPFESGANGVAMQTSYFAAGAERLAFACKEVRASGFTAETVGMPLVAKEACHKEQLADVKFHHRMAEMQARAHELADRFNDRVKHLVGVEEAAAMTINFAPCVIYEVYDDKYDYHNNIAWIFAEPHLEGRFHKWNNNAGKIYPRQGKADEMTAVRLDLKNDERITLDDVPQAFSHFTHSVTGGRELVCDLQGVWNAEDGFELTDPAIHHDDNDRRSRSMHRTDRGSAGVAKFAETHKCSSLCRSLGLEAFPQPGLLDLSSPVTTTT